MVNIKRTLERLLRGLEDEYEKDKNAECKELYNDLLDVIISHKASIQNVLFALRMIEWGYLRAKYLQLVEETVQIPEGNIPVPKDRK